MDGSTGTLPNSDAWGRSGSPDSPQDVVQIDAVQAESPMTQRALDTQRTAASSARGTPGVLLKFALANDTPEESRSVFDGFSGERRTGQV